VNHFVGLATGQLRGEKKKGKGDLTRLLKEILNHSGNGGVTLGLEEVLPMAKEECRWMRRGRKKNIVTREKRKGCVTGTTAPRRECVTVSALEGKDQKQQRRGKRFLEIRDTLKKTSRISD